MRNCTLATITSVGALLLLPSSALGQVPTQDSVTADVPTVAGGQFSNLLIDARSGPSGENPTGNAAFTIPNPFPPPFGLPIHGSVTCLSVNGSRAALVIASDIVFPFFKIEVTDNAATGTPDTAQASVVPASDQCPPPTAGTPITSGNITVVDAPPLPGSKDQCKNGGWRNYPGFKNEGACVAFVATQGKRPPT